MRLFWNASEKRLRALWRILLQVAMTFVVGLIPIFLVAEPLTALHKRGYFLASLGRSNYDRVINIIVGPLLTIAVIASVLIAVRVLDHRERREIWIVLDRRWRVGLITGLALGALLMSFVFVTEYVAGWLTLGGGLLVKNAAEVSLFLALLFSVIKVLCVGIYEETVFRGYLLRNVAEGFNLGISVILTSAVFATLHLTNDNSSALSTLGLFVNGILFAVAVLTTGRLSTAVGLHISWNLFEGAVYGFPVSGDKEGASVVAIHQAGPVIITGGNFGPEAGLIGLVASLLGIGVLFWLRGRKRAVTLAAASAAP